MEILDKFGFDPVLLVAQIVNFLIVLFVLKKFLYKPILTLLKNRKDTIEEGLKKAEEASVRLEEAIKEEKTILKIAQTQAKKVVEEARSEALVLSREMNENARKQTEKMIKDAQDQIRREAVEVERKLASNVSNLAASLLRKSLSDFFSENEQKEIMKKALQKVKKTN